MTAVGLLDNDDRLSIIAVDFEFEFRICKSRGDEARAFGDYRRPLELPKLSNVVVVIGSVSGDVSSFSGFLMFLV